MIKNEKIKIKYSKILPLPSFYAITIFNCIFVRKEYKNIGLNNRDINHEKIHMAQAYDFGLGFFGFFIFYIWYLLEWLLKLPWFLFGYNPYRSISFEMEAYSKDYNLDYLNSRKRFNWLRYLFKGVKRK